MGGREEEQNQPLKKLPKKGSVAVMVLVGGRDDWERTSKISHKEEVGIVWVGEKVHIPKRVVNIEGSGTALTTIMAVCQKTEEDYVLLVPATRPVPEGTIKKVQRLAEGYSVVQEGDPYQLDGAKRGRLAEILRVKEHVRVKELLERKPEYPSLKAPVMVEKALIQEAGVWMEDIHKNLQEDGLLEAALEYYVTKRRKKTHYTRSLV